MKTWLWRELRIAFLSAVIGFGAFALAEMAGVLDYKLYNDRTGEYFCKAHRDGVGWMLFLLPYFTVSGLRFIRRIKTLCDT